MLIDTSHPMIRPELERGLERGRKILQSRGKFCLHVSMSNIRGTSAPGIVQGERGRRTGLIDNPPYTKPTW